MFFTFVGRFAASAGKCFPAFQIPDCPCPLMLRRDRLAPLRKSDSWCPQAPDSAPAWNMGILPPFIGMLRACLLPG